MKVSGSGQVGQPSAPGGARPATAGGFSVPGAGDAGGTARASGVGGVGSIDALLALQQVETPLERRRRAVGRGGRILDVLDDMKLSLLDDGPTPATLDRLARSVRDAREATDDPGLDQVLKEIDTRAAVELAKLETSRRAA